MTGTERVWMTPQARAHLEEELAALMPRPGADGADAGDYGDEVVDAWLKRKARIREIHELLSNAVVGETPPDDGVAEPGMVLTVRFDDSGDVETFLLGARGIEDTDIEVYSVRSPLGSALHGARPGEQRNYQLPSGSSAQVTLLASVPYGAHITAGEPVPTTG